jgi:hypothetical protein
MEDFMSGLFDQQDVIVPLENAGKHVNCLRCGIECVVAETANRAGRPVQHADGDGFCPSCVITQWLQTELDVSWLLPPGVTICEALRHSHIQAQFQRIFQVGHADVSESQIDWERVIANWNLPLHLSKGRKKRKAS